MEYKLQDLIDIEQFQALQDRLNEIYSFPSAIIDNEGNILTATAWQDICTKFHRTNMECERECIKSDQYILSHLHEAQPAVSYRCPHGLVDNATPIIIDGIHYGNFFTGQFFLETPDLKYFKEQANRFGFDEAAYLEAVKRVPIWSKEQLDSYLYFIKGLIEVISSSGLKKLKEIEARHKIEETEERASTIISQMMDGFWVISGKNEQIIDVNSAMCEMLGYTREELLSMSIADVEAIDSSKDIEQRIKQIVRDGTARFQSRHRRKDGVIIDVEVSVTYLPSSNLFFAIHRDISERKRAEDAIRENEALLKTVTENTPDTILQVNAEGRITFANRLMPGLSREEVIGSSIYKWVPEEQYSILTSIFNSVFSRGESGGYESLGPGPNGETRTYFVRVKPVIIDGKTVNAIYTATDITERKQEEETLRNSEQRFRTIFEQAPIGMGLIDTHTGKFLQVNRKYCEIVGRTNDEMLSMDFSMITHPDDLGIDIKEKQRLINGEIRSYDFEKRYIWPDQSIVWAHLTIVAMWKEDDEPKHHLTMVEDITERKRAEEELHQSEERFRSLYENATIGMYRTTPEGEILLANPALINMLGYASFEELTQRNLEQEGYDPDYKRSVFRHQIEQDGKVTGLESVWMRKDGSTIFVRESSKAIRDVKGKVAYFEGTVEDITERKRIEATLKESEARYRHISTVISDIAYSCVTDTEGNYGLDWLSGAVEQITGYTTEELKALNCWGSLVIEDDFHLFEKFVINLAPGDIGDCELRIRCKDGSFHWINSKAKCVEDEKGHRVYGGLVDISERKQAENLLIESEERLKFSQRVAHVGHWTWDTRENRVTWSDEMKRIFGLDPETFDGDLNQVIAHAIHPDDWEKVNASNTSVTTEGKPIPVEYRVIRPDQSVRTVWAEAGEQITNGDGNVIMLSGIVQDITERKQAEESLYKAETKYHALVEQIPAIVYTNSAEQSGQTLYISPQLRKITGYEPEEWIVDNDLWLKIMHPDDRERVVAEFSRATLTGKRFSVEYRIITRIGEEMWIQDEAYLIRDEDGKPSYWQGVLTNITAHKQADLKIQEHMMRLDALRKIDQAISSSFDLNISLNILLSYAIRLLETDAATVLHFNAELNVLEHVTGLGFNTDALKKSSFRLGEGYAGRVALYQNRIQVQNLADEPGQLSSYRFLKDEGFKSYYGVPLIIKGKVIGVLEVFSRSNIERDSEWFNFLDALAGQAAIAIDNLTLFNELQKSNIELLMAYDDTIEGWSRAMDLRDEETEGHTRRVTELTVKLAEKVGVNRGQLVHIRRGALLHDIGKLGVPDHILRKPGALSEEEWVIMRQHPRLAYEMLKRITYLRPAIDIPYCHHEKWDGTGYPRGLEGEQIPISARLFAITDVWDALSNERPYRSAWPIEKTLEYIRSQSGVHFDPDLVEAFLELVGGK